MKFLEKPTQEKISVTYLKQALKYDKALREFEVSFEGGRSFSRGVIKGVYTKDEKLLPFDDFSLCEAFLLKNSLTPTNTVYVKFKDEYTSISEVTVAFDLYAKGLTVRAFYGEDEAPLSVEVEGSVKVAENPLFDEFAVTVNGKGKGIRSALGPAVSRGDNAIFDRKSGTAVVLSSNFDGEKPNSLSIRFSFEKNRYEFTSREKELCIYQRNNIHEDICGIPYRAINKNNTFPTPPAGWMTWYSVKFDACEEVVLRNAKRMKELFGEYGADSVWVDWEWFHSALSKEGPEGIDYFHPDPVRYPNGLDYISRKIKENGQTPVLWVGFTHEPGKCEFIRNYPEAVIDDSVHWFGSYVFDPTNKDYIEKYLIPAAKKVREWGYEALKWDVLPSSMGIYDERQDRFADPSVSSYDAFKNVIETVRETVGEDMYMLSCSGELDKSVLNYADLFDGARIGGDVFKWEEFIDSVIRRLYRLYHLHNTVLYCDPDNVVIREEFNNNEQARTRVSVVSLLGLPFTIGDELNALDDYRIDLIRRALPPLDAHTMDLRVADYDGGVMVTNLAICKPFDEWNVVGVSNLSEEDKVASVSITDELYLCKGRYHVYDYWNHRYLGIFEGKIDIRVKAYDTAVLCVKEARDELQIVSTSRHISQGGYDLLDACYDEGTRTLGGRSLGIGGEKYVISIYDNKKNTVFDYEITPQKTGEFDWSVTVE